MLHVCAQDPAFAAVQEAAHARPAPEAAPAKRKREEKFAWDTDMLMSADGTELSFEEV